MKSLLFPLMLAIAAIPASRIGAAEITHLGQPCRGKNILGYCMIADPKSGKDCLVLCNTNEATNIELLLIDFENDTGEMHTAPAGQGSWALQELPGGKLAVGTYYDGKILMFDLMTRKFAAPVQVPGEEYVWRFATGSDGRLYGGTYPHAVLAALDPVTMKLETFPNQAPPNMYLRYVTPTADGRVICTYGMEKMQARVFDPATRKFSVADDILSSITTTCLWHGYILTGNKCFDGTSLKLLDEMPFALPAGTAKDWSFLTQISTSQTLYLKSGSSLYSYGSPKDEPRLVCKSEARLIAGLKGVGRNGKLVGSFGQDYYVIDPANPDPKLKPIPVESGGRPAHFIKADGHGKLWGGPWFGQTLFHTDLKTSKTVNTGIVSNHGGEVYDVAFHDGKVYAVAYVGGDIIEYDPAKPWDQWNGKNPKILAKVGPTYIRPTAGVSLGPGAKLYSGWLSGYGSYGGALVITDPASGKNDVVANPLGKVGISGLATDDKHVYLGSTMHGNGLPNKKGELVKFGIYDPESRKMVMEHEFPGSEEQSAERFALDARTKILALVLENKIALFDTTGRKFLDDPGFPKVTGGTFAPGDGMLYFCSDSELIRVDLTSRKVVEKITMPQKADKVTVDTDGAIYVFGGPDLYRVRLK